MERFEQLRLEIEGLLQRSSEFGAWVARYARRERAGATKAGEHESFRRTLASRAEEHTKTLQALQRATRQWLEVGTELGQVNSAEVNQALERTRAHRDHWEKMKRKLVEAGFLVEEGGPHLLGSGRRSRRQ